MKAKDKIKIEAIKLRMKELAEYKYPDKECAHGEADDLLCELLEILGYSDIVNNFEKLDKWYA